MSTHNNTEEATEEEAAAQAAMIMAAMQGEEEEPRSVLGIIGDIESESANEVMQGFIHFNDGKVFPNPLEEGDEVEPDVEFLITTGGGAVHEMFAIYDLMNIVKVRRDIATLGVGKVFSAGVPLLINGTPGKRHITKNTRIMLHRCNGGNMGTTADMESSHEEMRLIEDMMIDLLAENTNLTVTDIKQMFSTNTEHSFQPNKH